MTLYVNVIRELRLRSTVDPGSEDPPTYTGELRWSGEAPNEHGARRQAILAWSRKHGEEPPFELEIHPAAE